MSGQKNEEERDFAGERERGRDGMQKGSWQDYVLIFFICFQTEKYESRQLCCVKQIMLRINYQTDGQTEIRTVVRYDIENYACWWEMEIKKHLVGEGKSVKRHYLKIRWGHSRFSPLACHKKIHVAEQNDTDSAVSVSYQKAEFSMLYLTTRTDRRTKYKKDRC